MSGNTFGATFWSDTKRDAPMLPQVSPIQRCPNCGTFYFIKDQEYEKGDDVSFELGTLTLEECKEAQEQFATSQIPEEDANILRIQTIFAYNDKYYRSREDENEEVSENISEEDFEFFRTTVLNFIESQKDIDILFKAELMREIGQFEECISILSDIKDSNLQNIKAQILEHAEKGICGVFAFVKLKKR
ncbi:MAG: hypothetical protein LUC88_09085 [Prevotella sp.]|nr:hypothetical protein [Prevotella sp.]